MTVRDRVRYGSRIAELLASGLDGRDDGAAVKRAVPVVATAAKRA